MTSRKTPLPAAVATKLGRCLDAVQGADRDGALSIAREMAAARDRATRILGARLLYLLRAYQEAVAALSDHLEDAPRDAYALRFHFSTLKRLRFEQEATEALDSLLKLAGDATLFQTAALHYRAMGRPDIALRLLERAPRSDLDEARLARLQLSIASQAGDERAARDAAERSIELAPESWGEVVDQALEVGLFELVERQARGHATEPQGAALLAQLAAYRGAWSEAFEHAAKVLAEDPQNTRAVTASIAAAVSTGDDTRAEKILANYRGPRSPELRTWQAELLRRAGEHERARDVLTQVQNDVSNYLAANLLWVLVKGELDQREWATTTAYDGLIEGQIQALGVEVPLEDGRVRETELRKAAREALDRMAGNRSPFPSVVVDGALVAVTVPSSPRNRARHVQHLAPFIGIEKAKKRTATELEGIGDHPIAECYDAELYLWAGEYEIAERRFSDILERLRRTVWGWIGLGASQTLRGDPERGLATLDEGIREMGWKGATVPVYRGEALYRLGRLDEAADELRDATESQASRVAAWVLRLLVEDARGNGDERDRCFEHLDRHASALLADAADFAGVDGWWPAAPSTATRLAVARACLELMRGNRSSSCALWFAPGTEIVRSVVYGRPVTSPKWEADEIRRLRTLL